MYSPTAMLDERTIEPSSVAKPNESAPARPPHAQPAAHVLRHHEVDDSRGLSSKEVTARRSKHGPNSLPGTPPTPWWRALLGQFTGIVIWTLFVAAIISMGLGEWMDAIAILAIVFLNGVLGFVQERHADQSLQALRRLETPKTTVLRDGIVQSIPKAHLVPGDVVEIEAGEFIPADLRLVSSSSFQVQEAALTGESLPVEKAHADVLPTETPLAERRNMAYMGTSATTGRARGVVTATGLRTELGRVHSLLQSAKPEPTPLQKRLEHLGRVLVFVSLALVALIFILHLVRGGSLFEAFMTSVSLAVAAIPEGMPAVVTLALAVGLQQMAKRHALVRKLASVETLGSVTVICSDKTGTLTRNEMTVREIHVGGRMIEITGEGYDPAGEWRDADDDESIRTAVTVMQFCNHAHLKQSADGTWQAIGDPTEAALLVAAKKAKCVSSNDEPKQLFEIPFDPQRKRMSILLSFSDGRCLVVAKGAAEPLLDRCTRELIDGQAQALTPERKAALIAMNAGMADRALRVLGLAYRDASPDDRSGKLEHDLIFVGLVGMMDPPRAEAKIAVAQCRTAGIKPVMITGDHPSTARAIGREIGIIQPGDEVLHGGELDAMNDDELAQRVPQIAAYARVTAEHKLRIVRAWKANDAVVAMTGDGINDAPAVRAADIGVAMGITGTDVTKEASDMVLTDDNFASIVNAIEHGRMIADNIRKFMQYLLACNVGEILFMLLATLAGYPVPLIAIQILWINLVTDGLPALALGVERPEPDVLERKPVPPNQPLIPRREAYRIILHGLIMAGVTLIGFAYVYHDRDENLAEARTVAFCVLTYAQLFYSLACRSQRYTLPQLGFFSNRALIAALLVSGVLQVAAVLMPGLKHLMRATPMTPRDLLVIVPLALVPVTIVEGWKLLRVHVLSKRRTA
jgi:Ca2+-transporting ATPase